jgi:phosphotransferase system enzyme I (PtsI)
MMGIGVSPGIAIGKAFVIQKKEAALTGTLLNTPAEIQAAIERFDLAISNAIIEVEVIKNNPSLSNDDIAILETQIELLSDPEIRDGAVEKIEAEHKNPNDALLEVITGFVQVFKSMDDEYMRARAADVQDIGNRILKNLNGQRSGNHAFEPDTIIIADDLSPSDTITMDVSRVIGFATQMGSKTSHAAIIARTKGIPAVVGCGGELIRIKNNDVVILDGIKGDVHINPGPDLIKEYTIKKGAYLQHANNLKALRDVPAITTDGMQVTLSANISGAEDMGAVFDNGGEGVGLLRTELLFMNRLNFIRRLRCKPKASRLSFVLLILAAIRTSLILISPPNLIHF